MKKYSVLLAIIALVLASLACQTVMGGGDNDFEVPDAQNVPECASNRWWRNSHSSACNN